MNRGEWATEDGSAALLFRPDVPEVTVWVAEASIFDDGGCVRGGESSVGLCILVVRW